MRLIDADAMLERNKSSIYDTTDLKEMLDNEPTAFDVEKVVNQLEEKIHFCSTNSIDEEWDSAIMEAIEIVKSGGINEQD